MTDEDIIKILKTIISEIEIGEISDEKKQRIKEFIIREEFQEKIVNFSQDEITKFLFLGWYIYNF
jgi:hypothetical protein